MPSKPYNGHKNWNHWNVALWIGNDQRLYLMAKDYINESPNRDEAARRFHAALRHSGITNTPDGAPYTISAIRHAMMGL